jgi:hypothetical protein
MNCSACGKANAGGDSFCEFCGTSLRSGSIPSSAPAAALAVPAPPVTPSAADVAQMGKSLVNSLTLGEKFVGGGVIASVLGFFLPAISISVPEKAGAVVGLILGFLGESAGADATHASISLFDVTKLLGAVYFILLLAIASGVLFYFSQKAATPQKLLISGFQVGIGSLYGPATIGALLFVPGMGTVAGIGYWLLGLGFCSIAAGGLITISALGKTAH